MANEILAAHLLTLHNLVFYQRLMARLRSAIREDKLREITVAQQDPESSARDAE
jgi:tRNA-guanine family transglycosylase